MRGGTADDAADPRRADRARAARAAAEDEIFPAQLMSRRQLWLAFAGLMLGLLVSSLDRLIVSTALPTIAGDLGGLNHIAWVITAYVLAQSVVALFYGKLGDLIGRKPVYLFCIAVFTAGSILSGTAHSLGELIAWRAVQGLGGGGLNILALTIVADLVGPRERGRYQGMYGSVSAFATLAGPVIGGLITEHASWRWVFYVNIPIAVVAFALSLVLLPRVSPYPRRDAGALPPDARRPPGAAPPRRPRISIDYAGNVLIGATVTCLVLFTTWGGSSYAWSSPLVVTLGVAAIGLLAAFLWWERRAGEPVLPLRLFRDSTFNIAVFITFMIYFAIFGVTGFMPLFLQVVNGASATGSGLLLVPLMTGLLAGSFASGQLVTRLGRYKWFPVAGMALAVTGMFGLSSMTVATPRPEIAAWLVALGLGIGLSMQVVVIAVQNTAPRENLGVATSFIQFLRQIGGSVGLSVFGAIFASRLAVELSKHVPARYASRVPANGSIHPSFLAGMPAPLRHGLQVAYATSLTTDFLVAAPFLVAAFALAIAMKDLPLTRRRQRSPAAQKIAGDGGQAAGQRSR